MISKVSIRPERCDDAGAIVGVIRSAFLGMPFADGDESELVDALRAESALSVSLVAEVEDAIVGQIAFSPARVSEEAEGWFALGPVAVLPRYQGCGIGTKLIWTGLDAISALGAGGCILTGDPAYYSRFGFTLSPKHAPPGEPSTYFMIKLLAGQLPADPIHFHEAFGGAA